MRGVVSWNLSLCFSFWHFSANDLRPSSGGGGGVLQGRTLGRSSKDAKKKKDSSSTSNIYKRVIKSMQRLCQEREGFSKSRYLPFNISSGKAGKPAQGVPPDGGPPPGGREALMLLAG